MTRVKTDENLHPDIAAYLGARGHDAVTVWDEGLRGKPDAEIAEACRVEKRVLVTLDVDFGDIRTYPPERFAGIIVLRLRDHGRAHVRSVVDRVLGVLERNDPRGQLWVVDEGSIRVWERGSESSGAAGGE